MLYHTWLYASNSTWPQQRLHAPNNSGPRSALERVHTAPAEVNGSCICTAEGRIQPYVPLVIREMKSALLKTQRVLKPPKKVFLPERLPNKKCKTHVLVILVVLLRERKIKRKKMCSRSSYSQSIVCSAVPYIWIHIYICMYGCIFLSGRGCIAVKVSTLELLTLTSYLRAFTLSSTIYHKQY